MCNYISKTENTVLWHQRLNHHQYRGLTNLHHAVKGLPKLKERQDIDQCDTFLACKLRLRNLRTSSTRHATVPLQGLSMDWSFIVQRSRNTDRYELLKIYDGNTTYLLIGYHKTPYLDGVFSHDKNPPLEWLNKWFALHKPDGVRGYYKRVDMGGELARHPSFRALLGRCGYDIEPKAPETPDQNVIAERPHITIANSISCMLHGAALDNKVWDYAFYFQLLCNKVTLHSGQYTTPFEQVTGKQPDL